MKFLRIVSIFLFTLFLAMGCGSSGGGGDDPPSTKTTTVSGTVLDGDESPIEGADVTISSDPISVTTDVNGYFEVTVEVGDHHISIKVGSEEIYSNDFNCTEEPYLFATITTQYDPNDSYPDADGDGHYSNLDCDDNDASINPNAVETCDGKDNDCDDTTDEGCNCINGESRSCGIKTGECLAGTETCVNGAWNDCSGEVGPDTETCDGKDNDCDGSTDEGVTNACGSCGAVPTEVCDGKDNNCDGSTDEGCDCTNGSTRSCGSDTGECSAGTQTCVNGVWDSCSGNVGPATEICGDGLDQDCDGSDLVCPPDPNEVDDDEDGFTENQGDCDDSNRFVYPGVNDKCGDGVDGDCSGNDKLCPLHSNYSIQRANVSPIIDGELQEYADAEVITLSPPYTANNAISIKTLWDNEALYIAYEVTDTDLNASINTRDGGVWNEDSIEWAIDTLNNDAGTGSYNAPHMMSDDYHGMVNILNTKYDSQGTASGFPTSTWNGSWQSAVIVNGTNSNSTDADSGYSVEVKVPWTSIGFTSPPTDNTSIGMGFVLNDKDELLRDSVGWPAGTEGGFENASKWQSVMLLEGEIDHIVLEYNGPPEDKLDIVFVPSHYYGQYAGDNPKWISTVEEFKERLLAYSLLNQYRSRINIFRLDISTNDDFRLHEDSLIPDQDRIKTFTVDKVSFLDFEQNDQIIFITEYEGYFNDPLSSHGTHHKVTRGDPNFLQIASSVVYTLVHEFGHSFGRLGDEYDNMLSLDIPSPYPNIASDFEGDTCDDKWGDLMGHIVETPGTWTENNEALRTVGCFYKLKDNSPGSWYKPTREACIMKQPGDDFPFCTVCERHLKTLLDLYTP